MNMSVKELIVLIVAAAMLSACGAAPAASAPVAAAAPTSAPATVEAPAATDAAPAPADTAAVVGPAATTAREVTPPATATAEPVAAPVVAQAPTKLNLNTATGDEFQTVPNVGNRMVREFMEYRPYDSIQQFRREIGKYVDEATVAEYEKYVYVPVSPNNADSATLQQLPGVDAAIAEQLITARPYATKDDFLKKLGELIPAQQLAVVAGYLEAQ
jgi:DNA uptake protein ComE-like DNA-binding protein